MISVSNEFKKAIKEPERRIKGYVEVLYDLPSVTVTPSVNATSTYTPTNEISNGIRVENLYGSVDYLPLDGSYITMGDFNTNIGYISDELFENLTSPTVTLSFSSTTINGITMYFRENPPTNMTLNYSDGTSQTIANEENIVQVIFDSPKTLTNVSITINDMMYQDRKVYIMEIDLGITQVYKDQDLIEFTVDEEVNKLVEEVPINETNIILNNMTDLFNPLNPKGIVPYLSENTLIKPYIGVLTETQGVEYVKMGEFYFDSYTNNSDATTTLVGKNIIKQLATKTLEDGLSKCTSIFIDLPTSPINDTIYGILSNSGVNVNIVLDTKFPFYNRSLEYIDALNWSKYFAIHNFTLLYANRNNILQIRKPLNDFVDAITKSELISDSSFAYIDRINTIKRVADYKAMGISYDANAEPIILFDQTVTLTKTTQNFAIPKQYPNYTWSGGTYYTFTFEGATNAEIKYETVSYCFVTVSGNIGANVRLIYTYLQTKLGTDATHHEYFITNKKENEKEKRLEINDQSLKFPSSFMSSLGQLEYTPSYEMSFEYNGDPSLEAGDYINVETPYGYKPLFIQKNRFKFDGGLSGSIEGVE